MALHTITGLTAVQVNDGTYKVNVGFTAADGDNNTLALKPEYKLSTSSTWLPATTTLPETVAATVGGVAVSGVWDLDKDFDGNLQGVTFNFRVTATHYTYANGSLTAIAASTSAGIEDGDYFTVGGVTFEFSTDTVVVAGRTPVTIPSATATATQVKAAIIQAINGSPTCTMSAVAGAGQLINLTSKVEGTAGNVSIVESISNAATLTPVGIAGGLAAEVVTTPVSITGVATGDVATLNTGLVDELTTNKHDVEVHTLEGMHTQKGLVAAGGFRWSRAKAAIEEIRAGKQTVITIFSDRALGEGVAVLVSPTVYGKLTGSESPMVVEKPAQWLMNVAWRSFSQLFKPAVTVYAIQATSIGMKGDIGKLKVIKGTTVAYLVSYTDYLRMSN